MTWALLIAQKPAPAPDDREGLDQAHNWNHFLTEVPTGFRRDLETMRLGEGSWLLPLDSALPAFHELGRWCQHCRVPYRVLFLDKEPAWVKVPVTPG